MYPAPPLAVVKGVGKKKPPQGMGGGGERETLSWQQSLTRPKA